MFNNKLKLRMSEIELKFKDLEDRFVKLKGWIYRQYGMFPPEDDGDEPEKASKDLNSLNPKRRGGIIGYGAHK